MRQVLAIVETNWGAISVCAILAAPAIGAIASGIRAPDTLQHRFGEDRRRARAIIEGDRIVPKLATLAFELQPRALPEEDSYQDARRQAIEANLQKTDYMNAVEELSVLTADYRDLQRFQKEAQRWSRLKAWASSVYLAGFVYPAVIAAVDGPSFPRFPLYVAIGVAALGAAFATAFFLQETGARNRLTSIVSRYE